MKNILRTIIIDDEVNAINSLKIILTEYCEGVEIIGTANSAIEGAKEIQTKNPDLIFLDIEMPNGTGFDMLDCIPERTFKVVFSTAYNHYAIKAIKYNAFDYILKPPDVDEVIHLIEKIKKETSSPVDLQNQMNLLLDSIKNGIQTKIILPTSDGFEIFLNSDFIRAEAGGSYATVYLKKNKKITVSKLLKDLEDQLGQEISFRPHKSHLININYIVRFINKEGGLIEMTDGSIIPLSRRTRTAFFTLLKAINIITD